MNLSSLPRTETPALSTGAAAPHRNPSPLAQADAERIEHLFRHALRAGRAHPLQPLLQRYRSGERA